MFTKNIKLIGVVALLVVVVMVASALIAIGNDKKVIGQLGDLSTSVDGKFDAANKDHDADLAALKTELTGKIESTVKDLNGKIDALKAELNGKVDANTAEIEALKADLATLNETVATLTATLETLQGEVTDLAALVAAQGELIEAVTGVAGAGINVEGWNAATDAYWAQLYNLEKVYNAFFTVKDEYGVNIWSVVYLDYYAYEEADDLLGQAQIELLRATSVENMEAIVAQLAADLDAIPTRMEMLLAALDRVEADGVTIEDLEDMLLVEELLDTNSDDLYAKGQKDELVARFEAAVVAIVDALANEVVRLVAELPAVEMLTLAEEDVDALDHAYEVYYTWARYYRMANDTSDISKGLKKNKELRRAVEDLEELATQYSNLRYLKNWADYINDEIAYRAEEEIIGCNMYTHNWLVALENEVANWDEYAEEITDNAVNHAMLNHDGVEAFREEYEVAVASLRLAVEEYIDVVKSITHITPDSKAVLESAQEKYNAVTSLAGTFTESDIDTLIDVNVENGDEGFVEYSRIHAEQWKTYQTIIDLIAKIEGDINGLRVVTNADKIAKDPAVKPVYGKFDPAKADQTLVDSIEGDIWTLLATYGQVETVISADHLTVIKTARVYLAQQAALATLNAVHAGYNGFGEGTVERLVADGRKAWYENDIALTVQSYAFVADKDHYGVFANDHAMNKLGEYAYTSVISDNFVAEIENKYFELENEEK